MRPCALPQHVKWMGNNPRASRYILGGFDAMYGLKVLLCSSNDALPQHRSVLRAIRTLNNPKNCICLLGKYSPIKQRCWSRVQGLMWGARGPFLPVVATVGYVWVGPCWPLEANVRLIYCKKSKNCLRTLFFYSYVDPIHSWHLTQQLKREIYERAN